MQLTREQQLQVADAKARGERRVMMSFTAAQEQEWQDAVALELAGKDENIAHFHKIEAAARQPGLFGDVRRAISSSRRPLNELAEATGINPRCLSDFRAGDSELSSAQLDRLVETLGLRLMQEIPQ